MGKNDLTDHELAILREFVKTHVGLYFPPERNDDLKRGVASIASGQHFVDHSACLAWILSLDPDRALIEMLASSFSVGETYFFREPDVFTIVEEKILPAIISRRREQGRYLRIWSAGCSTGEEAYSLAILLSEIIPDIDEWSVTILATDINPIALKKAEDGVYTDWSFRSLKKLKIDGNFLILGEGRYKILDTIKKLVTISYLNLVEDTYPALLTNTNAMDLVFCRNLLMYFSNEVINSTVEKIQRSLVPEGRLIVSMTETMLVHNTYLVPDVIDKITTFRRQDPPVTDTVSCGEQQPVVIAFPVMTYQKPGSGPSQLPGSREHHDLSERPENNDYTLALGLFESGHFKKAEKTLELFILINPSDHRAVALMAQILADQGDLKGAHAWCERAIGLDKLNPSYHHLFATILQEEGRITAAVEALRRALYADPSYIPAHFTLAHLKRHLGMMEESEIHFKNASELLSHFGPDDIIGGTGGMSAGYLRRNIGAIIGEEGVL